MWYTVLLSLLLAATSHCQQTRAGSADTDISVGLPGTQQAQEWQPWSLTAQVDAHDEEDRQPVTRLRRRRRKRIRPHIQDEVASADYEDQPIPVRPTRPRYGDSAGNHDLPVLPADRPYRAWPRRRRLKKRPRPAPFREDGHLDEDQETSWRDDDYHGGRPRPRRPVPDLDGDYIHVPRPRARKRRPPPNYQQWPSQPEPLLEYPDGEPDIPLPVGTPAHSSEVMIYGDDPVSGTTHVRQAAAEPPTLVPHHEPASSTTTERVNTFRPSRPRQPTAAPPYLPSAGTSTEQHPHDAESGAQPITADTGTRAQYTSRPDTPQGTSPLPHTRHTHGPQDQPGLLATTALNQEQLLSSNEDTPGANMRNSGKPKKEDFSEQENLTLVVRPPHRAVRPLHRAVRPLHRAISPREMEATTNAQPARGPSHDARPSSDTDPEDTTGDPPPSTMLPSPVKIRLEAHIRSIEQLIQMTRASLQRSWQTPGLSSESTVPSTAEVQAGWGTESVLTPLQHTRDEIVELLRSHDGSSRLARILQSRNMTLEELLAHRERGSSQQHLSEIFGNHTRAPATQEQEPEMLEKDPGQRHFSRTLAGNASVPTTQGYNTTAESSSNQQDISGALPTNNMAILETSSEQPQRNCSSQTLAPRHLPVFPQGKNHTTAVEHEAGPREGVERKPRVFDIGKLSKDTNKSQDSNKYTPIWKTLYPHSFGVKLDVSNDEEPEDISYKRVDLDDSNIVFEETAGKVDKVQENDPAANFASVEAEEYESVFARGTVLAGFSIPVKSGIIASCAVLGLAVVVFAGILVGCRWRQRRARRRYVEGIVGARERSASTDELRVKGSGRSLTPVLMGARDVYSRAQEPRRYYLWATIRKTLRYK